ncbi:MAG TPA: hypothetical protein VF080_10490, partial [Solirubrobacteraceae bacterium]
MRLDRDGVRLAGVDFGGEGPGALLLHGLAGHAGEWAATARWLTRRCRVVGDGAFVVERLGLGPAILVGQSLGGQTALLLLGAMGADRVSGARRARRSRAALGRRR